MHLFLRLFTLLFITGSVVQADVVNTINNNFRTTYEEIDLADTEKMGLMGTSFLFDKKMNHAMTLYSGLGVYSALKGQRGGFFTGGLEFGLKYRANNWIFDAGVFVGGGGGGSASQGGGLMLRPHVGLMYDFKKFKIGANYNQVKFPNGNISSNQFGIQLEIPFQTAIANKLSSDLKTSELDLANVYMALTTQRYEPKAGTTTLTGSAAKTMNLASFEAGRYLNKNFFFFAEAGGPYNAEASGYGEFLGGLGYTFPATSRLSVRAKASIGGAGGGSVDTNGGLVYKATLGATYKISPRISLGFDYGVIDAVKGSFEAKMAKASLNYNFGMVVPASHKRGQKSALNLAQLDLAKWSVRTSSTRYLSSNTLRKSGTDSTPVDLFSLKLDRKLSPNTYLTGQTAAAYKGGSGGYASGVLGFGVKKKLTPKISLQAEILAGAAGGGSIATDNGGILQPMAGLNYQFSKNWQMQLMGGKIKATKGTLNTNVLDFGLVYDFNTLEKK